MRQVQEVLLSAIRRPEFYQRAVDRARIRRHAKEIRKSKCLVEDQAIRLRRLSSNKFEVIDGYRRLLACRLAGIETIPAWIEECDNEDALVRHFTYNAPDVGLQKIEIGYSLLRMFPPGQESKGGRGKRNGIRTIAKALGRKPSFLFDMRAAADVTRTARIPRRFIPGQEYKFAAIRKTNKALWSALCHRVCEEHWTFAETTAFCSELARLQCPDIPEDCAKKIIGMATYENPKTVVETLNAATTSSANDDPLDPFSAALAEYEAEHHSVWKDIQEWNGFANSEAGLLEDLRDKYGPRKEARTKAREPRPVPDDDMAIEEWSALLKEAEAHWESFESIYNRYTKAVSPDMRWVGPLAPLAKQKVLQVRFILDHLQARYSKLHNSSLHHYLRLTDDETFASKLLRSEAIKALHYPVKKFAKYVIKKANRRRKDRKARNHF